MTGLVIFLLLGAAFLFLSGTGAVHPGVALQERARRRPRVNIRHPEQAGAAPGGRPTRRQAHVVDTALMIDLVGAMLAAGEPLGDALAVLAGSCPPALSRSLLSVRGALELGADWEAAWSSAASRADVSTAKALGELGSALRFAAVTGASSAGMIHAYAANLRRQINSESEQRAAALGVRLVVPLGLCYLPAFICLGVLPVVIALVPKAW